MIYRIKKGRHRAWPFVLGLFFNRQTVRRTVTFGEGCRYWIEGPDMLDTNKLFGLGYFWSHHTDSARFGWRYDNAQSIVLVAYCYVNGERIIKDLAKVPLFTAITCALYVQKEFYVFDVLINGTPIWNEVVKKYHLKKWSFPLGLYFGGNKPAPQTMQVEIKKV
jgi:hypothetical protein